MSIFDPFSEELRDENETLKKRLKELEELTASFDTRGLARLYQHIDKLEKENIELKTRLLEKFK